MPSDLERALDDLARALGERPRRHAAEAGAARADVRRRFAALGVAASREVEALWALGRVDEGRAAADGAARRWLAASAAGGFVHPRLLRELAAFAEATSLLPPARLAALRELAAAVEARGDFLLDEWRAVATRGGRSPRTRGGAGRPPFGAGPRRGRARDGRRSPAADSRPARARGAAAEGSPAAAAPGGPAPGGRTRCRGGRRRACPPPSARVRVTP
jgi:hypothetical protein